MVTRDGILKYYFFDFKKYKTKKTGPKNQPEYKKILEKPKKEIIEPLTVEVPSSPVFERLPKIEN